MLLERRKRNVRLERFLIKKIKKTPRLQRRTCPRKKNRNALQKKKRNVRLERFLIKIKKTYKEKPAESPCKKEVFAEILQERRTGNYLAEIDLQESTKNLLKLS